jgi:putative ABC transport system ATP-binding protein
MRMNQTALIEISDVYKVYHPGEQEVRALDGVSLRIRRGEFVAIVGNSGSGKSTLMNLLGCLDMPSRGDYFLSEQQVSRLSDDELSHIRNREIGFVFQGFNLIPSLDAVENVELPLLYRGLPREKRRLLAHEALGKVGLTARLHHRPAQMSGGQQQRVAIARAIAARPPIILADEPTGNLDSESGEDVMRILTGLWQDGKTVILITHDAELAARAHRTIHIHDGRIVRDEDLGGSDPEPPEAN